jgi:protein TonB
MKLRDLYRINSRRGLLVSILVHVILLTVVTTATLQLTTPEGYVTDDTMEMNGAGGQPTPVEVVPAPAPKKSVATKEPEAPKEPEVTVSAPAPKAEPEPAKEDAAEPVVEEQKIEEPKAEQAPPTPEPAPKAWTPVEDTDVNDGPPAETEATDTNAAETTTEAATAAAAAATETGDATATETNATETNATETNATETGAADASKTAETGKTSEAVETNEAAAAVPPGTSPGEDGGEPSGPVHTERELTALPGNPMYNYPYFAKVQRIEGTVTIRFTLKPDGEVAKVWVAQSSGSSLLDKAAVEGHYKWKYKSGIDGVVQKKVIFRLKGPAVTAPYR